MVLKMTDNPFKDFHRVPSIDELIDLSFSKGTSLSASIPKRAPKIIRAKRNEVKRIQNVHNHLSKRIKSIIQSVPNLEEMHPFYQELSHLLVDNDHLRQNLGKLNGLIPVIRKIEGEIIRKVNEQDRPKQCAAVRRQFFARVSSVMRKQKKTLEYLEETRKNLRIIPTVETNFPSVVVAGYPNVGKSSLVTLVSSANPEICEYPFTTKQIIIGVHRDNSGFKLFQLIDTPGILDRSMEKRNKIEKQSILALRTISNIIVYIFDPTETCGYSIDNQISLFHEIKSNFIEMVKIPYLIVFNKMDFVKDGQIEYVIDKLGITRDDIVLTNAKDGVNLDKFIDKINALILKHKLHSLDLSKFNR